MTKEKIELKVVEALEDDAYKGIARVDADVMRQLDVKRGDVILIKGNRETVAIVDRAYPADVGEGIIRIDGILRRNSKSGIGEVVSVSKANIKEAKKIMIAPAQKGIMVQGDPENLKRGLLGRSVVKGDIVVLGGVQRRRDLMSEEFGDMGDIFGNLNDILGGMGFGNLGGGVSQIRFLVVNTNPGTPVIVTENTQVTLNPKAVDVDDEKVPEITYEDIGGLSEEIKKIREMVEIPMKRPEIFEKLGIEPPKGVLLHGPPGTGKTLLAKAVANESDANFKLLNGPEIMSKFYGESEKKIRDIFEEAEKTSPTIIFIDEIDAIAPKREDVHGEVERRVVSQILTMMDGLKSRGKVIVIGATNRVNALDPALRRPGRFDREININVPDKEGRLAILKIHTRGMPIEGRIYPEVLEKKTREKFNFLLNKYVKDIEEIKEKISELTEKRKLAQENLLRSIINKIERNEKTLIELKEKEKKIKSLEKVILKEKKIFKNLINKFAEFFETKENISFEGIRKLIILNSILPKEKEIREAIFDLEIIDKKLIKEVREVGLLKDREIFASLTHGFVGADLEALAKEAAMNVLRKHLPKLEIDKDEEIPQEVLEKLIIRHDDFRDALKVVRPSAMREVLVEAPTIGWEGVGGLDKVKQELKEAVEWPMKYPQGFKRMGIRPSRGILLYGPPGTGKTLLAKAVAKESEANFIQVKGPSLLSMWVGKSEEGVRKIFERARQVAPCIIFFDELDSLAGKRGVESGTKVTERVLNQLLAEMDGLEDLKDILIVAATNRPDMLDPAILRPGRFDKILLVNTPEEKGRLKILEIHTKKMPLAKDVKLNDLAKATTGYSGADIESMVREAAMLALRESKDSKEVKLKHFREAMSKIKPSVNKSTVEVYKKIEENFLKSAKAAVPAENTYLG